MTTTRQLLKLDPDKAVVEMLLTENDTFIRPDSLKVENPRIVDGRRTAVDISYTRTPRDILGNPVPEGVIEFTYNRHEVTVTFAGLLETFRPNLPYSSHELLRDISRLTGLKFHPDDFVEEAITRENARGYRLKAHPYSLRWFGDHVFNLVEENDLSRMIPYLITDLGQIEAGIQLADPSIVYGSINATVYATDLASYEVGYVVNGPSAMPLIHALRILAGSPLYPHGTVQGYWAIEATPQANNLFNSRVVKHERVGGRTVFELEIDPHYCTNYTGGKFDLFYLDTYHSGEFEIPPKTVRVGVPFMTDATAFARVFGALHTGDVINEDNLPANLTGIENNLPWVNTDEPTNFNLRGAEVLETTYYAVDRVEAAIPGLERFVRVRLSDLCTNIGGEYVFFYRPELRTSVSIPAAEAGQPYEHQFEVTGGRAPYEFVPISLVPPPGTELGPTGLFGGVPRGQGQFTYNFNIVDADGVTVPYRLRFEVVGSLGVTP